MDKIDMLLQHVTDNTDKIIEGLQSERLYPEDVERAEMTQEELFDMLLQMVVDGEVELIQDEDVVKFKLPDEEEEDSSDEFE